MHYLFMDFCIPPDQYAKKIESDLERGGGLADFFS
jgi:hypothetical protein